MSEIEIIVGLIIFLIVIYMIGFGRAKLLKIQNDKTYLISDPGPLPINVPRLEEVGFIIHNTKDKLYALHPNGVSMTHWEGSEWSVKIKIGRELWHDRMSTMDDLLKFCERHYHKLKKEENGPDHNN